MPLCPELAAQSVGDRDFRYARVSLPFCAECAVFAVFACLLPIAGDKMVQLRVLCTLLCHRLLLFPYQMQMYLSTAWSDEYSDKFVGEYPIPVIFQHKVSWTF
jgi:hypothetical protein